SEKNAAAIRALARENFRRIGENFAGAIKMAFMNPKELEEVLQVVGTNKLVEADQEETPQSRIMAVGHFGNFEAYARLGHFVPQFKIATTYRGLRHTAVN